MGLIADFRKWREDRLELRRFADDLAETVHEYDEIQSVDGVRRLILEFAASKVVNLSVVSAGLKWELYRNDDGKIGSSVQPLIDRYKGL